MHHWYRHEQMKNFRATAAVSALVVVIGSYACAAGTLEKRGEASAQRLCASCHAIRATGDSPHPAAPAFRTLGDQMDLSEFARRLRRGLLAGHEDMPMFRFKRDDADAMAAYIRSVQGP